MDEKELIRKIRNSLKAKKTRAQITSNLQKKGYKLAYIDKMINVALMPKRIFLLLSVTFVFAFLLTSLVYIYEKKDFSAYENPLQGFTIIKNSDTVTTETNTEEKIITKEQIKIDENFINFLLRNIGVSSLHRHPLTFRNPIINIVVDGKSFYSIIGKEIMTEEGSEESADLQIITNEETLLEVLTAEDPEESILDSFNSGESSIELLASEADLFAKGYFSLYQKLGI